MISRCIATVLISLLTSWAGARRVSADNEERTVRVGAVERTYILHVP
jgi:hypothetical protein